ncbi:MAG: DUF883 family protein [Rhizobiales bacterium]|nr:DUF883 family protein [Hyphomicrobiales bacterium]
MATPSEKELSDNLDRIRADIASLTDSVKTLMADSAGIQSALKSKVNSTARQAANVGERIMSEAGDFGAEALDVAQKQATQAVSSVEGHIRQNPFAAVMIAAGIGLALGLLNRK